MKVSVVIGSLNRFSYLKRCINALRLELCNTPHEMIIVDGGSTDGTLEWLVKQKDVITICQHNFGSWNNHPIQKRSWGYFMNLGFKCAQGEHICMLSDDSVIYQGAIKHGIALAEEEKKKGRKIGGVAFYFRDNPSRMRFAVAVNLGHLYVNHGLFLNSALHEVGYVTENDYHFYFADTDLSLKIKEAGYEIISSPNSFVEHYIDIDPDFRAQNNEMKIEDQNTLINKWSGKAFPARKINKYRRVVGYWDFID